MLDLSFHEIVTFALFLSTLLLLAIASVVRARTPQRAFALLAIVTGAAASIGMVSGPVDSGAWTDTIPAQVARSSGGGGAGAGGAGGASAQGQAAGRRDAGDNGIVRASYRPPSAKSPDAQPFRDCPHCPEMVPLQPGIALQGGRAADPRTEAAELPQRIVRLAKPFAIGRTEITVAQFAAFTQATRRAAPACAQYVAAAGDTPADCITFADAEAYGAWLSQSTGHTYRLPSASEWEYAARAGSSEAYPGNDVLQPEAANIGPTAAALKTAGAFPANGFGLRDMTGSLAEMVSDCWVSNLAAVPADGQPATAADKCSRRTLKDAAWWELPVFARVSSRRPLDVTAARPGIGFRVVREMN